MQFIDVTTEILYKESQDEKVVLSLVNACVSHELRNPLNSICAQALTQKCLFAELVKHIEDPSDLVKTAFGDIEESLKV